MASIIIAGRPNSEDTSECTLLIENIQAKIPTLKCVKVLKHPEEWENYAEEICNLFGFHKITHPLIFYTNGRFIGGKDEFFKHIKTNFQTEILSEQGRLQIESKIIKAFTEENIHLTNDEYYVRKVGSGIQDIIDMKMNELTSKDIEAESGNRYNTLESVFSVDFLGEMKVFYKYSFKFKSEEMEFIEYPDPLEEGLVEVDVNKSKQEAVGTSINENQNEGSNYIVSSANNISSAGSEGKMQFNDEENEIEDNTSTLKMKEIKYKYYKTFETPVHVIKNAKKFEIKNDYGIGYRIMLNPYFTFYGETILYHNDKNAKLNTLSEVIIPDYGKLPSLRKIDYDETLLPLIKTQINISEEKVSLIQSNIYTSQFLSENDIFYLFQAVKDTQGLATLRILPYKYNDYKHFGSSIIKILKLPLKDIGYEDIPLNTKVEQTVRHLKREKIKKIIANSGKENTNGEKKVGVLLDNEEYTQFFDMKEFFTIETYKDLGVKHLVKSYTWHSFKMSDVKKDIYNMLKDLSINQETGYGFNLILTKNYLFISPLINPFAFEKNAPIFAEPHFFTGIFTLPLIEAEWPDTVKGEYLHFDLGEVLNKSTNL